MQNPQLWPKVQHLVDIPMVYSSSTECDNNPALFLTTLASPLHASPHLTSTLSSQCFSPPIRPTMPAKSETESEPKVACTSNMRQGLLAQGQLGNLKGNVKDVGPDELAQLMLEYSLTETSIMSILSLGN